MIIGDKPAEFMQLINIKNGELICDDKIMPELAKKMLKKL